LARLHVGTTRRGKSFASPMGMTTLPLALDDEPMGIILRAGQQILRPAKIWAYCWFLDEGEDGDHTHRHLPVDPKV
jgi:hypothetical protein